MILYSSIVPKWKEQLGLPQWSEAVVIANDSGQTSFAVIPFLEDGSTELQTIFVLARYQGYWFFENWSARLVELAIETEGEPDDKMQTLIDFYNFYIYGHWDPNNGSESRSHQSLVCQRDYFFNHGTDCLEVCIYCTSSAFISIDCPGPYDFVIDFTFEDCSGEGGGSGPGTGGGTTPPQLDAGGWSPYFGPIMTDGNPISWVNNEGMTDPVWPGGISGPFDDFLDGEEAGDLRSRASALVLLLNEIIDDLDLDLTVMELRDILLEDDLECLDSDEPEICVLLTLIGIEVAPEVIPAPFESNTNLSPAELADFLKYVEDIENLVGQSLTSDQIDWVFESDENFLMAMEILGFIELYPNNSYVISFWEDAIDALKDGIEVDASEGIIYYDDGVMEQQGPYIWTGPRERIPSSFQTSDGTNVTVTFGTTSDGINADQEVADILVEALLDAIDEANQNLTTNEKITEIYISSTTNGLGHGSLSNHYGGTAFDLSRINGTHINALRANNQVTEVSESLANHQYMREIFSPSHHLRRLSYDPPQVGEATNVEEHNTHIHFAARNH